MREQRVMSFRRVVQMIAGGLECAAKRKQCQKSVLKHGNKLKAATARERTFCRRPTASSPGRGEGHPVNCENMKPDWSWCVWCRGGERGALKLPA